MRVFLVGFMGSGKSTVGRHVAAILGLEFVDLDRRIEEEADRSVAAIFELEGEAGFRERERRALRQAAAEDGVVVAAGGGAVVAAANRELMAERGTTIWLNPDFETIVRRVSAQPEDQRPLFVDPEQARELYESRRASYALAALRVDVGAEEDAVSVAVRVAGLLQGERCAT